LLAVYGALLTATALFLLGGIVHLWTASVLWPIVSRDALLGDRGAKQMRGSNSHFTGYVVAAVLGAIGGGLVVAFTMRVIPNLMTEMMNRMMSGMMQNMMSRMQAEGVDPEEMCRRMMAQFAQGGEVAAQEA
jgi:hypothetical protein